MINYINIDQAAGGAFKLAYALAAAAMLHDCGHGLDWNGQVAGRPTLSTSRMLHSIEVTHFRT